MQIVIDLDVAIEEFLYMEMRSLPLSDIALLCAKG